MNKIKNTLLILSSIFLLTSCSAKSLISDIPNHEFKTFEYHRTGNFTSAHIIASDARRIDDKVTVERINITTDYGPFVSFNIKIEGYRR